MHMAHIPFVYCNSPSNIIASMERVVLGDEDNSTYDLSRGIGSWNSVL